MDSRVDVIVRDPDILGGTPVFRGSRVPLQALFDSLETGETLEQFLEGFPSVNREMALAVLEGNAATSVRHRLRRMLAHAD
jgi:uncharacterized protein (DUF433 family)